MLPTTTKILLVEDDPVLGSMLTNFLERENYTVTLCPDGEVAWSKFMKDRYDLCLLDIMLPGKLDGIKLAKNIREKNVDIPLMLLSSKMMEGEMVNTFHDGIDGYLIKPYNFEELLCRIKVFLKRSKKENISLPNQFELGDLVFDFNTLLLKNHRLEYELTMREAELLRYFCLNPNRLLRKEEILIDLWGKKDQYLERSLGVFIAKLRKYIKSQPSISIQTIPRIGFKFNTIKVKDVVEA
jgi:DNA-binding response OmpR family regulator